MSAHDAMNDRQFFHGTSGAHSFQPGDVLDPLRVLHEVDPQTGEPL